METTLIQVYNFKPGMLLKTDSITDISHANFLKLLRTPILPVGQLSSAIY